MHGYHLKGSCKLDNTGVCVSSVKDWGVYLILRIIPYIYFVAHLCWKLPAEMFAVEAM